MKVLPKRVLDIPYQGEMESRRLWNSVTQAIQQPEGPDWDRVQREKTLLGRSLNDKYLTLWSRGGTTGITLSPARRFSPIQAVETQILYSHPSYRKGKDEDWISIYVFRFEDGSTCT